MSSGATEKIVVPTVGESITEGVISSWLKQDGEYVKSGESLFELETDKITTEVPAQNSGIVRIKVAAGTTVSIGSEVGLIEVGQGSSNGKPAAQPAAAQANPPRPPQASASQPTAAKSVVAPPLATKSTAPTAHVASTNAMPPSKAGLDSEETIGLPPSVRRLLREQGKSIVSGAQIAAAAQSQASASAKSKGAPPPAKVTFVEGQREFRKKLSPLRQRIAQRLVASQQETATLTTFNEVDMSAIMDLRNNNKDAFKAKFGVNLGFMSFFVRATIAGLRAVPEVNARLENNEIVYQNFYDIGIAVSTEKGLVVPVLRGAENLSLADIEKQIAELAGKARDNRLTIDELQGGTFTISNGGIYGSLMSTPILNPPQSGILGMHAIKKRPMVVDESIEVRPMMYLALSYDHRVIDGKESVTFLVTVKEYIENPAKFLLDLN